MKGGKVMKTKQLVYRYVILQSKRHVRRRRDGENPSESRNAQTLHSKADTRRPL